MRPITALSLALVIAGTLGATPNGYVPLPSAPTYQLPSSSTTQTLNASCGNTTGCPPGTVAGVFATGMGSVSVSISGTFSGTVQFESATDCINFNTLGLTPQAGGASVTTTTGTGAWQGALQAQGCFQVRMTAYTSGNAVITVNASAAGGGGGGGAAGAVTTTPTTFVPSSVPTLFATNTSTCNPCSAVFQFIPLSASKSTYILSLTLNSSITQVVTLEYGTTTTNPCDTGTVTLGPFPVTAGSAVQLGFTVIPSGKTLCILPGASGVIGAIAMAYQQ